MNKLFSDKPFYYGVGFLMSIYVFLILALVFANISQVNWADLSETWSKPELKSAIKLTLLASSVSTLLALIFAVPIAYALARFQFPGRKLVDAILDIPMVLPPLVIGLSLLILFNKLEMAGSSVSLEKWLNSRGIEVTFSALGIVLAQFTVVTSYALRMMKNTFQQIDPRSEQVALTMGCNRSQAFWSITLPQAGKGTVAAGVMAWARAIGEFGPILVFAGATRGKTEVLSTSIFLELNMGNLAGAAALSILMITLSLVVIFTVRLVTEPQNIS